MKKGGSPILQATYCTSTPPPQTSSTPPRTSSPPIKMSRIPRLQHRSIWILRRVEGDEEEEDSDRESDESVSLVAAVSDVNSGTLVGVYEYHHQKEGETYN